MSLIQKIKSSNALFLTLTKFGVTLALFLAVEVADSSQELTSPRVCRMAQRMSVRSLSLHYSASKNFLVFLSEIHSRSYAEEVIKQFIQRLDPYGIFLTEAEYQELLGRADRLQDVIMKLHFEEKQFCSLFQSIYEKILEAQVRHINLMRQHFTPQRLTELKSQVLQMGEMMKRSDFITEEMAALRGFPASLFDLTQKAEKYFSLEYLKLRERGESDPEEAWATAYHRIKKKRADYDFMDGANLAVAVADAMLNALDQHSKILTKRQAQEMLVGASAGFYGIGISFVERVNGFLVTALTPGGPAEKQGALQVGDLIIGIDGDRSITQHDEIFFLNKVRGQANTSVRLEIIRHGQSQEVTITRGLVGNLDPFALNDPQIYSYGSTKIGYYRIGGFFGPINQERPGISQYFYRALKKLDEDGADALIVDLRGNGGGDLKETLLMLDLVLNGGSVLVVERAQQHQQMQIDYRDENVFRNPDGSVYQFKKPMVILLDEKSASASEVFAGSLQDYRRALILGSSRSFGKGSVQIFALLQDTRYWLGEHFPELEQVGVKLTTELYFLPSGRSIEGVGVAADVVLSFPSQPSLKNARKPFQVQPVANRFSMVDAHGLAQAKYAMEQALYEQSIAGCRRVAAELPTLGSLKEEETIEKLAVPIAHCWYQFTQEAHR